MLASDAHTSGRTRASHPADVIESDSRIQAFMAEPTVWEGAAEHYRRYEIRRGDAGGKGDRTPIIPLTRLQNSDSSSFCHNASRARA
jgi:hypothetical protein